MAFVPAAVDVTRPLVGEIWPALVAALPADRPHPAARSAQAASTAAVADVRHLGLIAVLLRSCAYSALRPASRVGSGRLSFLPGQLAADPCLLDGGLADLMAVDTGEVGIDHGKVGVQAGAHRTDRGLQTIDPGTSGGISGEERGQFELLPGQERVAIAAPVTVRDDAVDGHVRGPQRVRAADRPVAATAERCARVVQRAERVLPAGSALTEERDGQLVHLRLVRRPQGLDVGGGAELGEPADIVGMHDLEVGEVVPLAVAVGGASGGDRVEGMAYCAVTEGVEVHLETRVVQRGDESRQLGRVDEVQTPD